MRRDFFNTYRTPVIFGMLVLLAGGFYAFRQIQVSLFPEITFPKIKIIAENGEQPVDKMMITVTKPLEEAIKQVPDLKRIRSATSRGSCEISAFLDWKSDVYTSQQLIESRIAEIRNALPAETQITVERMNPSILPVMSFSVESNTMSLMELKLLAEYTIKPYLSQVDGVSTVRVQGGKVKEYWIEPDPDKMARYGLTPQDISQALAQTDFIESNGFLNSYRRLYLTLTDAGLYTLQDIENIPLGDASKGQVRISDIGEVRIHDKIEYIKINANGREGVLVNVLKQPNANLIQINDDVNRKVGELSSILPAGVVMKPFYQQAEFVNTSITSIRDALLIGLFLAMVVAILFLRSVSAGTAILFIIPSTLAASLLVVKAVGYNLNIMTIGAIAAAIGLIIDDAVIVIEQLHRTREEHPQTPVYELIQRAIRFSLSGDGRLFAQHHRHLHPVLADVGCRRGVFQDPCIYDDHRAGVFLCCDRGDPSRIVRQACAFFPIAAEDSTPCRETKIPGFPRREAMGFFPHYHPACCFCMGRDPETADGLPS